MDLEVPEYKECGKCEYCEEGEINYDCKYLRQKKVYFQSDGSDTAEQCKYYKYKGVSSHSSKH